MVKAISRAEHTQAYTQQHRHPLKAYFRENQKYTSHLWAWFGSRGERSRQGQRSSCSWVEGHQTTKPRNREEWTADREKARGGGKRIMRGRERDFREERGHHCLKNSNIVRIPYKCVNGEVFAL